MSLVFPALFAFNTAVDTLDSATNRASPGFIARLRESTAAREGLYVLAAQGLATLIALAVDRMLFHELPKSERGTLSAALSVRNILLYIADMGLSLTTIRVAAEYFSKQQIAEARFIFRRALVSRMVLALCVSLAALLLSPALASVVLGSSHQSPLIWAATAALFGMTATSWGGDVSRSTRQYGRYFWHQVVESALRAAAVIGILFIFVSAVSHSSESVLWAIAIASTLAGAFSILLHQDVLARNTKLDTPVEQMLRKQLRDFGRYAGGIALLVTIGSQVEILMIIALLGPEQTAIYDGGRRLALVLPLVVGAISTVLLPRAASINTLAGCKSYLRKAVWTTTVIALIASGGLAAISGIVVPWFSYPESTTVLRWLCLAYGLSIIFFPVALVLYPLQRAGTLLFIHAVSLALSIGFSLWMIPRYGAIGAAWSALIVRIVSLVLLAFFIQRILKSNPNLAPLNE